MAKPTKRVCSVDGCDRRHSAKGYCATHYARVRIYGDPLLPTPEILPQKHHKPREYWAGKKRPWQQRLDDNINTNGPLPRWRPDLDACWEWLGSTDTSGHGVLGVDGSYKQVHRLVYELLLDLIPEGMTADHLCRFTRCCNPVHIELVSLAENSRRARECARCLYLSSCPRCACDLVGVGRVPPISVKRSPLKYGDIIAMSREDRYWAYVDKDGPESVLAGGRCWDWHGMRDKLGYALFHDIAIEGSGRKTRQAYHVGLELVGRPVPEGLVCNHLCRRGCCVNPGHIEFVTQAENISHRHRCARCEILQRCPRCDLDIGSIGSAYDALPAA